MEAKGGIEAVSIHMCPWQAARRFSFEALFRYFLPIPRDPQTEGETRRNKTIDSEGDGQREQVPFLISPELLGPGSGSPVRCLFNPFKGFKVLAHFLDTALLL